MALGALGRFQSAPNLIDCPLGADPLEEFARLAEVLDGTERRQGVISGGGGDHK